MYIAKLQEITGNYSCDYNSKHKIRIESREKLKKREYLITVTQCNKLILEVYIETDSDGIKPYYTVVRDQLYIGVEHCIAIVNLRSKELKKIEIETVFFTFLLVAKKKLIIAVCEADLLFLSEDGSVLRTQVMNDIITDAKLKNENLLQVTFFEGECIDVVL